MTDAQHSRVRDLYGLEFSSALCRYLIALGCWRDAKRILANEPDALFDAKFQAELREKHDPDGREVFVLRDACRSLARGGLRVS